MESRYMSIIIDAVPRGYQPPPLDCGGPSTSLWQWKHRIAQFALAALAEHHRKRSNDVPSREAASAARNLPGMSVKAVI